MRLTARLAIHRTNARRGHQAGRVLPREDDLTPRRREEAVMQRAIAHLAAEEVHEHAEATEEERQPQVEVLGE
jgi:hypothetical protein